MKYTDIINITNKYFQSALDIDIKISLIDKAAKMLWSKKVYRNIDYDKIETVADQTVYTVASDCRTDMIDDTILISDSATLSTANFTPYKRIDVGDKMAGYYNWYIISDTQIGIYPSIPTSGYYIITSHCKKPETITVSNYDTKEPDFSEEFQLILAYALVAELASMDENIDIDLANNATRQYNSMYGEMIKYYKKRKITNKAINKLQNNLIFEEIAKTL